MDGGDASKAIAVEQDAMSSCASKNRDSSSSISDSMTPLVWIVLKAACRGTKLL